MKRTAAIVILLAALAHVARAQDTNFGVRVPCEMQATSGESEPRLATLTWLQGTTPLVVAEPLRRGRAIPYDADTRVRMVIGPSSTGALYAVRTNAAAVTNGYAIQWPTIGTNTAGAAWFYTILFDKDGRTYWTGSGDLYITATTSTASNGLEWIEYIIPSVGWADIAGDPADNSALVDYIASCGDGSAEDAVARGMAATNAASIVRVGAAATNAQAVASNAAAGVVAVGAVATNAGIDAGNALRGLTNFPRTAWNIWTDANTNYYVRSPNAQVGYTSTSFSAAMDYVITNAGAAGVVEIGPTMQDGREVKYEIDAPIYMTRRAGFFGITVRGQGDYGTYIGPKANYTGQQIVSTGSVGILRFQNIRFDGFGSANTNPIIDVRGSAELVVESCEFAQTAGPSFRYGSEMAGNIGWNYFSDVWFYGTRHNGPLVELMSANNFVVQDFQFDNCHFYVRSNFPAIKVSGGSMNHVQINDTHFLDDAVGRTEPLIDFTSGVGHIVNGCVFVGLAGAEPGIRFASATSNNFRGAVVGNNFSTSTSTNLVVVSSNSHGVVIAANHGSEGNVNVEGLNAMGWVFRGYGTTANNAARGDWFAAASNAAATAYGWGNHAAAGYLTGFTETDPVAMNAGFITAGDLPAETDPVAMNAGFLTEETDPNALLADGSRPMSGVLDMAYHPLTNVFKIRSAEDDDIAIEAGNSLGLKAHDIELTGNLRLTGALKTDLDMGGNSITNASMGSIKFTDGTEVSSENVGEWNSAYGWGDHAQAGYLVSETIGNAQRITLGSGDVETVPAYGEILFGYPEESKHVSLRFIDNDVVFGPTNSHLEAWSLTDGTNIWKGRINDYEAARIASLPAAYAAGTTNYFIRPDGGTNTISFDATGNMIFAVDGATALTIRTNGNVGVKHGGSGTYSLYVSGDIYATSRMRALDFRASDASSYFLDPNGESMLASANFDGSLTATQGVTKIILPTSTNGLVSGTLWNNHGTVSVMP